MPIKCFVSQPPVSCYGGSLGRAKKDKKIENVSQSHFSVLSLSLICTIYNQMAEDMY